jgi:hypothetical protein
MFRGRFEMNDPCPVCGLVFQREEGYFLGAMYVSYGLASGIMISFYFLATALLPDWNGTLIALLVMVPYLLLVPAVFRYSRVVWTHFERAGCPTDVSAGAFERGMLRQSTNPSPPPSAGGKTTS